MFKGFIMIIILNFKAAGGYLIRDNRNYTEFIALKKNAKMPYFQGFSGISKNQGIGNYAELNNYTF